MTTTEPTKAELYAAAMQLMNGIWGRLEKPGDIEAFRATFCGRLTSQWALNVRAAGEVLIRYRAAQKRKR